MNFENYEELIMIVLLGRNDVYVSMPTGSGKSLCFQLPAVLEQDKVAIVFSPLIALIKVRKYSHSIHLQLALC